jgi:glycosyltransferase involved in cell wall biosynthesis
MSDQFLQETDDIALSVIVPVKDGIPLLHEQLQALLNQQCSLPWELIVADNGSNDGTADVVRSYAARDQRVRLVDAASVRGPAATRNLGVRYARGSIFAFCDADDVVHPGWLESWISALADADVSGGLMDYWSLNEVPTPDPARPRLPPAGRQFGFLEAAGSGNMAVRREAFESVGGFDEELVVGEDTDLSWRLQLSGRRFTIGEGVLSRREQKGTYRSLRKAIQYGRCGPILYQRHRDAGLKREVTAAIRAWLYLLVTAPLLVEPSFRRTWTFLFGWRVGRLVESCKRFVFFP